MSRLFHCVFMFYPVLGVTEKRQRSPLLMTWLKPQFVYIEPTTFKPGQFSKRLISLEQLANQEQPGVTEDFVQQEADSEQHLLHIHVGLLNGLFGLNANHLTRGQTAVTRTHGSAGKKRTVWDVTVLDLWYVAHFDVSPKQLQPHWRSRGLEPHGLLGTLSPAAFMSLLQRPLIPLQSNRKLHFTSK